ncbi:concanavalin A-like lectin/glucanase domain-containing protein, partial [Dunaliella salina]
LRASSSWGEAPSAVHGLMHFIVPCTRVLHLQTLHTSGIQQLGWCTVSCPFTAEEGVGDAPDSYAYDGKRTRKWSVKASPYGQTWAAGDVIGCCLDLDAGEMSFYRNGVPLGVAFSGIRKLQHTQLAFFPAASISYAEKCELNFGGLPFQYPVRACSQ